MRAVLMIGYNRFAFKNLQVAGHIAAILASEAVAVDYGGSNGYKKDSQKVEIKVQYVPDEQFDSLDPVPAAYLGSAQSEGAVPQVNNVPRKDEF